MSWGRYPNSKSQKLFYSSWTDENKIKELAQKSQILIYGLGRSYGDSCLNSEGLLLDNTQHSHFLSFDETTGILKCQSGVTFDEIIQIFMPRGWFLPVTPGTKFVTVGGALANDVHGKNHHKSGSFGNHVLSFKLIKSTGESLICSEKENPEAFKATIGGLGLTGFIDWVEFRLIPNKTPYLNVETIQFSNLEEFLEIEAQTMSHFDYTVSWIDVLSKGANQGKGLFSRGSFCNHAEDYQGHKNKLSIPLDFPSFALNPYSVRAFNFAYYNKQLSKISKIKQHYDPFFYPLDAIQNWNRIYGKNGFLQYQFVVPQEADAKTLRKIMSIIAEEKGASFLTVLKRFGDIRSKGMLSFPRPGLTYALDFPANAKTFDLLKRLDKLVMDSGGAVYPAKDSRMSSQVFKASFPLWNEFAQYVDPGFRSDFWARVILE
jgi:FAD/FMN-containing dehydrogenase